MGVKHLWQIVGPVGKPVQLESLTHRRLAIDTSIWLNHFIKAMRDKKGNMVRNAHLKGLFARICKLLFFGVKPVFVFDGVPPILKKNTTARRQIARDKSSKKLQKIVEQLILNQVASDQLASAKRALNKAKREKGRLISSAPAIDEPPRSLDGGDFLEDQFDDLFGDGHSATAEKEIDEHELLDMQQMIADAELENLNIDSEVFEQLPSEIQMEILMRLKQLKKTQSRVMMRRVSGVELAPEELSEMQLESMLERSKVSARLRAVQNSVQMTNRRIASNPNARYTFVRNVGADDDLFSPSTSRSAKEEVKSEVSVETTTSFVSASRARVPAIANPVVSLDDGDDLAIALSSLDDDDEEDTEQVPPNRVKRMADVEIDMSDGSDVEDGVIWGEVEQRDKPSPLLEQISYKRRKLTDDNTSPASSKPSAIINVDASIDEIIQDEDGVMDIVIDADELEGADGLNFDMFDEAVFQREATTSSPKKSKTNFAKDTPAVGSVDVRSVSDDEEFFEFEDEIAPIAPSASQPPLIEKEAPKTSSTRDYVNISVEISDDGGDVNGEFEYSQSEHGAPQATHADTGSSLITVSTIVSAGASAHIAHPAAAAEEKQASEPASPIPTASPTLTRAPIATSNIQIEPISLLSPNSSLIIDEERSSKVPKETLAVAQPVAPPSLNTSLAEDLLNLSKASAVSGSEDAWPEHVLQMEKELEIQNTELRELRRQQAGQAQGVSDDMIDDCKELLQLFGIPYVESPSEADSQCAKLEQLGLVDGIVSDDSDMFLFGGRSIFRHAFSKKKHLELYDAAEVADELSIGRYELISLALLLGSDYTDGVTGVGSVTASEIVKQFPGKDGLKKFRDWVVNGIEYGLNDQSRAWFKKHKKLRQKLHLDQGFPSEAVKDAYENPVVDPSTENFEWSCPDLQALRQFCKQKFDWESERTDEKVLPIVKRYNQALQETQPRINTLFLPVLKSVTPSKKPPTAKRTPPKAKTSAEREVYDVMDDALFDDDLQIDDEYNGADEELMEFDNVGDDSPTTPKQNRKRSTPSKKSPTDVHKQPKPGE